MAKKKLIVGQTVTGTLSSVSPLTSTKSGVTYIKVGIDHPEYGLVEGLSAKVDNFWAELKNLVALKGIELSFEYTGDSEPNSSGTVYPRFNVRF